MAKNSNSKHQKQFNDLRARIRDPKSLRRFASEPQNGNQYVTIDGWEAQVDSSGIVSVLAAVSPNDTANSIPAAILALGSADGSQILTTGGTLNVNAPGAPVIMFAATGVASVAPGDQLPAILLGIVEVSGNSFVFGGGSTVTVTAAS